VVVGLRGFCTVHIAYATLYHTACLLFYCLFFIIFSFSYNYTAANTSASYRVPDSDVVTCWCSLHNCDRYSSPRYHAVSTNAGWLTSASPWLQMSDKLPQHCHGYSLALGDTGMIKDCGSRIFSSGN